MTCTSIYLRANDWQLKVLINTLVIKGFTTTMIDVGVRLPSSAEARVTNSNNYPILRRDSGSKSNK